MTGGSGGTASVEQVIEASRVVLRYGGVTALDGVDLRVSAGEVVGLIGPNGAGKTSLINCLGGSTRPTAGWVRVCGRDIAGLGPHQVAGLGLGRTFQRTALVPELDVMANLMLGRHRLMSAGIASTALGTGRARSEERRHLLACREVAHRVGLGDHLATPAANLAFGLRKRVELGRVLASEPAVVLLDEPTAGLSAEEADGVVELVRSLAAARSIGMVLVDHDLRVVAGATDQVVVLDRGRVLAVGSPAEVAADPEVIRAYLGPGAGHGP